jgi:CRISPR-associated endonuclease Cas2
VRWVIAYDVSDDAVRRRVDLRLRCVGWRIQRSVFASRAPRARVEQALTDLRPLLDPATDSIVAVPVVAGLGPLAVGSLPLNHVEPTVL